jgi:NADPH2:quinone reductase
MKTEAVVISEQGAADVMSVREVEIGSPGPGEVLLEQSAIGLNYMDVYQRSGHYPLDLPSGLGLEAAGRILQTGDGVTDFKVDDRIAYGGSPLGAYARHRIVSTDRLVPVPDGVSDEAAAAVLMKGMTVEYLLNRAYTVKSGENVLFYAVLCRIGRRRPARRAMGQTSWRTDDRRHVG